MSTRFWPQLYAALGRSFDDPTAELLHEPTRNPLLCGLGTAVGNGLAELRAPFDRIWDALSELRKRGDPAGLDELRVEHTRLFYGPPAALISPYEHAYHGNAGIGQGSRLAGEYAGAGLSVSEGFKDLADHVCLELEFMSSLLEHDPARADRFHNEHLLDFLPAFAAAVCGETRSPFYRALADALAIVDKAGRCTNHDVPALSHQEQTP